MNKWLRITLRTGGAMLLLAGICMSASAQLKAPGTVIQRPFAAGKVLVWVKAGAGVLTDVQQAANTIQADVERPLLTPDMYLLKLRNRNNKPATDADVLQAVSDLNKNALFRWVGPDIQMKWHDVTPNDPRFKEQWHLPVMNVPKAWDIQKGSSSVVIAILDSGTQVDHEDLKDTLMGGRNFGDPANPNDLTDKAPHGTHVSGIAAATTNNALGVSGVVFSGSKIYFAKITDPTTNGPIYSAAIDAITYIRQNINKTGTHVVMNMSFGNNTATDAPDPNDPLDAAIVKAANENIISCISAGNDFTNGNPASHPANDALLHPNIICVAACGPNKEHSVFSQARSYTTIAAPGGNDPSPLTGGPANNALQILSTLPTTLGGPYGYEEGTSMASPACAGVVALLLSAGADPNEIRNILTSTADRVGQSVPNVNYGYGVVDAYAALNALFSVTIMTPNGTGGKASGNGVIPDPVETLRPTIRISVSQVTTDNLVVRIDNGNPIRQATPAEVADPYSTNNGVFYTVENVRARTTDANGVSVPFSYDIVIRNADLSPGQHTITVVGTKPGSGTTPDRTATDTRTFTITPHLIPAGRAMISFPYYEFVDVSGNVITDRHATVNSITPETYLGTDFRLARWVPNPSETGKGHYVYYSSFGPKDAESGFVTPGTITRQDGDPANLLYAKFPLGLGFWSDTSSAKPVLTRGQALTDRPFVIPLKGNGGVTGKNGEIIWNMIGDPFPFDVPFNSLLVDTPNGRLSIQQAADQGYILPNIYSYDGDTGYTFRTLPDGALRAWNGHWIGVTSGPDITLVVPPVSSSRAAAIASRASTNPTASKDGWTLKIAAHTQNLHDTYNFIGVSSRAADTYDLSDVAKPPMVSPYVSVGVSHSDWGNRSDLYAKDIRSGNGSKQWQVVVSTDQPNSDVTLTWDNTLVPRNVRLLLKDEATGQTTDMRTRVAMTFNSGSDVAPRRFTITSQVSTTGAFRISNVNVRTRANTNMIGFNLSSDATYEVKILNSTGNPINTLVTRAAGTGDVNMVWNGRDNNGRSVAAGTYIVQVRATNADKETVKAIQPFTVVR